MAKLRNNQLILPPQLVSTAGATTNDLSISSSNVFISPTTNLDAVTGLLSLGGNLSGTEIYILNTHASNVLVLPNNSANSSASNRFITISGQDIYLAPNECVIGRYDSASSKYRISRTKESVYTTVTRTTTQAVANNTLTIINWDSEVKKRGIIHDNVTNSSRLTVPTNGDYRGTLHLSYSTWSGNSQFLVNILKNGSLYETVQDCKLEAVTTPIVNIPFIVFNCVAGDYIEVQVEQGTGASRNLNTSSTFYLQKIA